MESFIPIVHFKRLGEDKKYKLVTYYEKGLSVLNFYEVDHEIQMEQLTEIELAVSKNIPKLGVNLDK